MIKRVQICTDGECGGDYCYSCRLKALSTELQETNRRLLEVLDERDMLRVIAGLVQKISPYLICLLDTDVAGVRYIDSEIRSDIEKLLQALAEYESFKETLNFY